ncbi:MAG: GAF and ANTAR domain-containing protein [Egicoccus sp.]
MRNLNRLARVLTALESAPAGNVMEQLCVGAADLLGASGIAVAVASAGPELVTMSRTDAGAPFDRLQSDFGEGPAWTAHSSGWPVIVPDLAQDDQWPAFGPAASDLGLRAVFGFPMRRGSARVGALTLYRAVAGELSDDEHADAVAVARVAVDLVIAAQAGRPVDDLDEMFQGGGHDEVGIHQASGMVSVQLGVAVAAALSVLRAHAFAAGRPLRDVAADVIARRLRMTDTPDP